MHIMHNMSVRYVSNVLYLFNLCTFTSHFEDLSHIRQGEGW
jgi:hypothetical protein